MVKGSTFTERSHQGCPKQHIATLEVAALPVDVDWYQLLWVLYSVLFSESSSNDRTTQTALDPLGGSRFVPGTCTLYCSSMMLFEIRVLGAATRRRTSRTTAAVDAAQPKSSRCAHRGCRKLRPAAATQLRVWHRVLSEPGPARRAHTQGPATCGRIRVCLHARLHAHWQCARSASAAQAASWWSDGPTPTRGSESAESRST